MKTNEKSKVKKNNFNITRFSFIYSFFAGSGLFLAFYWVLFCGFIYFLSPIDLTKIINSQYLFNVNHFVFQFNLKYYLFLLGSVVIFFYVFYIFWKISQANKRDVKSDNFSILIFISILLGICLNLFIGIVGLFLSLLLVDFLRNVNLSTKKYFCWRVVFNSLIAYCFLYTVVFLGMILPLGTAINIDNYSNNFYYNKGVLPLLYIAKDCNKNNQYYYFKYNLIPVLKNCYYLNKNTKKINIKNVDINYIDSLNGVIFAYQKMMNKNLQQLTNYNKGFAIDLYQKAYFNSKNKFNYFYKIKKTELLDKIKKEDFNKKSIAAYNLSLKEKPSQFIKYLLKNKKDFKNNVFINPLLSSLKKYKKENSSNEFSIKRAKQIEKIVNEKIVFKNKNEINYANLLKIYLGGVDVLFNSVLPKSVYLK